MIDGGWGYVAAGYGITLATVVAYGVWLGQRMRRARRGPARRPGTR